MLCVLRRKDPLVGRVRRHNRLIALFPLNCALGLNGAGSQVCVLQRLAGGGDLGVVRRALGGGLGNGDRHRACRFCINSIFIRCEFPCCFILAYLLLRCTRCDPLKLALDRLCTVRGVGHRAGKGDGAKLFAPSQRVLAQGGRTGGDNLVGGIDVDGQVEIDNITGSHLHRDRADLARRFCRHGLDRQNQLAVLDFRAPLRCIVISAVDADSTKLIRHIAVFLGAFQFRQQRGQIERIHSGMIVRNVQFPGFERGRGECLAGRNRHFLHRHLRGSVFKNKVRCSLPGARLQLDRKARRCISRLGGTELYVADLEILRAQPYRESTLVGAQGWIFRISIL